jgi:hypothetical protein
MWSEVQFLAHVYGENSIGMGKLTLCAPQIPVMKSSYQYYDNQNKKNGNTKL